MNAETQIKMHITGQPEPKRTDLQAVHQLTLNVMPGCKLWFYDGTNEDGKVVANPTIGYGSQMITYANGKSMEWFRIGVSGNKTGISVYILGIKDKKYLAQTYGKKIGKAKVTGYCIRFNALKDIDVEVLESAIQYGLELGA